MKLLTKDQILGADDREATEIEVPEWDGTVRVMSMTAKDRDDFETSMIDKNGKAQKLTNFRAKFIAKCVVDEEGSPMFTPADLGALGSKSGAVIGRLFDACRSVNGMTEEDVAELEGE